MVSNMVYVKRLEVNGLLYGQCSIDSVVLEELQADSSFSLSHFLGVSEVPIIEANAPVIEATIIDELIDASIIEDVDASNIENEGTFLIEETPIEEVPIEESIGLSFSEGDMELEETKVAFTTITEEAPYEVVYPDNDSETSSVLTNTSESVEEEDWTSETEESEEPEALDEDIPKKRGRKKGSTNIQSERLSLKYIDITDEQLISMYQDALYQQNIVHNEIGDELIHRHKGYIKKVAHLYHKRNPSLWKYEDAYSVATYGAFLAYKRFKLHKSYKSKFTTYLMRTMNGQMITSRRQEGFVKEKGSDQESYIKGYMDNDPERKAAYEKQAKLITEESKNIEQYKKCLLSSSITLDTDMSNPDDPSFSVIESFPSEVSINIDNIHMAVECSLFMDTLTDEQRTVYALFFQQEMTSKEIANTLSLSSKKVETIIASIFQAVQTYSGNPCK